MVINIRAPWDSPNVRFGSKADMCNAVGDVCFTPESGHVHCNSACPLCANNGHSSGETGDKSPITIQFWGLIAGNIMLNTDP